MKRTVVFFCLISTVLPTNILFDEEPEVRYMISATMDVLQHTHIELWKLALQRQMLRGNAPYEIGFLVRTSEERYRKMVDLYNASVLLDGIIRTRDQILHLQKIEKLHWDVLHLTNMLHEVERKYKLKPQVLDNHVFYPFGVTPTTATTTTTESTDTHTDTNANTDTTSKTWLLGHDLSLVHNIDDKFSGCATTSVDTSAGVLRGRPYGGLAILWRTYGKGPEVVPPVYLNGSPVRVVASFKYLGHFLTENLRDDMDMERERRALAVRCVVFHCLGVDPDIEKIMSELSWTIKPIFLDYISVAKPDSLNSNSPTIQHIRKARSLASTLLSTREFNETLFGISKDEDDDVMKMKLFRLMYESVKDSDLKIKRAELVKADYENSTGFDLGYVFGDASDKLNVMIDISKTLKRMYDIWRPVEHVNAYEQIANLAIEVTHLADMVRTIVIGPGKTPGPKK
ncbi:uncharacterized protein LOC134753044 [Cydia strobilella]|uniref:uncharacterized protein LOC134753044 n=1 Tax=Cydia strobilella TaxID=1100964 RepID=UPI003003CEA9